jgi:hypothetical protein
VWKSWALPAKTKSKKMTQTGQVIQYDVATWKAMQMVKNSIKFYEEQPRPNDVYGTAKRKEKEVLKELMKDRIVH